VTLSLQPRRRRAEDGFRSQETVEEKGFRPPEAVEELMTDSRAEPRLPRPHRSWPSRAISCAAQSAAIVG